MSLTILPPIASAVRSVGAVRKSTSKKRLRKLRYCRQRSRRKEDLFHLRRLGSGFFQDVSLDSAIFTTYVHVSLLESQHGRLAIGSDLPEIDDRSQASDMAGSFKGSTMLPRMGKQTTSHRSSWPCELPECEKEYMGGVPVVAVRDGSVTSESSSHHSTVPKLPPIRHALSPIKDVSRETTQQNISLPPIGRDTISTDHPTVLILPATPQQSTLVGTTSASGQIASDRATMGTRDPTHMLLEEDEVGDRTAKELGSDRDGLVKMKGDRSMVSGPSTDRDKVKPPSHPGEGVDSSPHHRGGNTNPKTKWKGRRGPGSQADSFKGSMIMAPDGEIIRLGGSVPRGVPATDVGNLNDVPGAGLLKADDDSGVSDDEPDEWGKAKKFSLSQKSDSVKKSYRRGSVATSSSVSKEDLEKLSATGKQLLWGHTSRASDTTSQRSSVTEKDIMDTLTDHAQKIAERVLNQPLAGNDLQEDVKDAIAEIMGNRRANSAVPTASEYRDLIKQSLATAVARSSGLDPDSISEDADISPELLEALASHKLTPDQIEIVSDADGRTRIQSKVDLGGVEEGHLFIAPGKDDGSGIRRQVSIPADRVSVVDDVGIDRISYQGAGVVSERGEKWNGKSKAESRASSKPGSIAGITMADLHDLEGMVADLEGKVDQSPELEEDNFLKAVKDVQGETTPPSTKRTTSGKTISSMTEQAGEEQTETPSLPGLETGEKKPEDLQSQKSTKTGISQKTDRTTVSQKSEASKDSKMKGKKTPEEKEEPFVVGKPKEKKLKKGPLPPNDEKKKKKEKKKKNVKKKEEEATPEPASVEESPLLPDEPPIPVEKEPPPRLPTPMTSEPKSPSPEFNTDESEMEFNIVREVYSPDREVPQRPFQSSSPPIKEDDKSDEDLEEDSSPKLISNREARAAKRTAAAAKKREEVERRRREKEQQTKREKGEVERQVALQREMEEGRRKIEDERRQRKEQEKEADEQELQEKDQMERRKRQEADRERKAKEDYQRKLEEIKRKQYEEEMRRHEMNLQRQREEEERRVAEELMLSQMAEQERLEYEKWKQEEEQERLKKEMEEKIRCEEEAKKAMEEAQRLAEEMARKQAELEARLKFNRNLQLESNGMSHSQEINRAFVFSYYELLQWIGLDIPEFELAKLADY